MCASLLQFGAMLLIVNLLIKMDSTVICVPCMLEHVCYEPFSFKKLQIRKISYVNWLNFMYLRNKGKPKTKRLCMYVLGTCVQNSYP